MAEFVVNPMNSTTEQLLAAAAALPPHLQREVLDFVQFLQFKLATQATHETDAATEPNGAQLARLMEAIAKRGTAFKDIEDPVAWQREIRKDRELPGRDTP